MQATMLLQTMRWYKRQMIMVSVTRNIANVNSFNLQGLPRQVGGLFWARFVWSFVNVSSFNFQNLSRQMGGFSRQELWKVLPMWTFSTSMVWQEKTNGRFFWAKVVRNLANVSPFNLKYSWFSLEFILLVCSFFFFYDVCLFIMFTYFILFYFICWMCL